MNNTEDYKSLCEFIEKTLEAADQIICDSFAILNEHDDSEEIYKNNDIRQRIQKWLTEISAGFNYELAESSILEEIKLNSYADFDFKTIQINFKLFVDSEQPELFPSFGFGVKLGLLSDLTALYLGMAKYLVNKNKLEEATKYTLKAGVAIGKVCGIQDEARRITTSMEYKHLAQQQRFEADLKKYQKEQQSKIAKKKAAEDAKNKVKNEIKKYWEDWQEDPSLYKHLNRFVSVIKKDFKISIHIETVRKWIKDWSAEKYVKEQFELYFPLTPYSYHYDAFDKERFIYDMTFACKKWGIKRPHIEFLFFHLVKNI